jgi:PAS domain-containing protein
MTSGEVTSKEDKPAPKANDTELEELLQFLCLMPIGVIKFRGDGTADLLNPMVVQMLMPLIGGASLDNVYVALGSICPELREKVLAFEERAGIVIEQRRIDGRAGRQSITLSLTVARVGNDTYMAALKDVSRLTEMLAFAFASADMLIDIDADGTIAWAGGAFQSLLDVPAKDFIGKSLTTLINPQDRPMLAAAMAELKSQGRQAPLVLRLANADETRCVLSGLALDGPIKRFFITVGSPPTSHLPPEPTLKPGKEFGLEAESWIRSGLDGRLGLLDVPDWQAAVATLGDKRLGQLRRQIGRLGEKIGAQDLVIGEVGDGRFGVLSRSEAELDQLKNAFQTVISEVATAEVRSRDVALEIGSLTPMQAERALRLVLAKFATNGAGTLSEQDLATGPEFAVTRHTAGIDAIFQKVGLVAKVHVS